MPTTKKEQRFHANGQLEWEGTFVDGMPDGIQRWWHPNGTLASETPMRRGRPEGVGKHWNEKGELVGTWEVHKGTGVMRMWHPNEVLHAEFSYVDGEWTGRQRTWFEDGELVGDVWWLRGRRVSRKKYLEACKADPSLPTYDSEPKVESWETKMRRLTKRQQKEQPPKDSEALKASSDRLLDEFLTDPTRCEARAWLNAGIGNQTRTLGEIPSHSESMALVEEAYTEGVAELFVVKVVCYDDGFQNSGILLARLPARGKKRKSALSWCNEQNSFQGFDPEDDDGQEWVTVQLD